MLVLAALVLAATRAGAATVTVPASRDNTLYEDAAGALSNGAGQNLFAGRTGVNADFKLRRSLLAFDIAAAIPAGATVDSVTLRLALNATSPAAPAVMLELHRALASWGEGTSNAGVPGGGGAPATAGDATWIHRAFPAETWTNPGGDFVSAASAVAQGSITGFVNFTSPQLATEVQSWLDSPSSNFGWLLLGDENAETTAKRFASRESPTASFRPALIVEFTPVPEPGMSAAVSFGAILFGGRRWRSG